jgi:hypothetical protein
MVLCLIKYGENFTSIIAEFSQTTSKIRTANMFVVISLEAIFNTEFVIMCMIYLHTQFHILD